MGGEPIGGGGDEAGGTGADVLWVCSEGGDTCVCQQTTQQTTVLPSTCTLTYPCCLAFDIDIESSSPVAACTCCNADYLDQNGNCDELMALLAAEAQYSSVRTVASCP
jgi:hypothetical protein